MTEIESALTEKYSFANPMIEDCGVGQGQTRRLKIRVGKDRYMAKHIGDCSPESVESLLFECSYLADLRAADVPVAANLTTVSGAAFASVEGRPLVVYEWAEGGIEWPAPPEKASALGAAVARMHAVSCQATSPRAYDIERLIDRPLALLEPYATNREEFDRLVKLTDRFRTAVLAIPTEASCFGSIHGDIHQGNCHFHDFGLTIVDFALCGVGYRAYDLTGFLWPMRDRTIEDESMRICCSAFLNGYESVRPVDPAERDAIPSFVQLRALWETGDWIDTGTGRSQPADVVKSIQNLIRQFEAID